MKKPKTYKELLEIVNPKDLLEVLNFSGKNDVSSDKYWWDFKREFSYKIFKSMERTGIFDGTSWINPCFKNIELKDDHYELIIRCIQDFYWWSSKFHHQILLQYFLIKANQ